LPDDRKPANTRNHKAEQRSLANVLLSHILLLYRRSRETGGKDRIEEALMDTIRNRRSIRKYTAQPVPQELVTRLLEAAMSAPSAGNEQPWEFIVITDREVLQAITKVHPYSQMLKEAPLAVVVCGNLEREKYPGFWVEDCSAATENILLEAEDIGLGGVWLGVYPHDERVKGLAELLGLPSSVVPLSIVALGYPAEKKPPAERFDPSRVHTNRW
jgi:nitroreductase